MKIVTISWVRNECDILEAFVRHYAAFSSAMLITVHRSMDNSLEILEHLKAEGLPLHIATDSRATHDQNAVLSQLLHRACHELDADWVLPMDADEFLRGDVAGELSRADTDAPLAVFWRGYVPLSTDQASEKNVLKRIQHRRSADTPPWQKVLVPRTLVLRYPDLSLTFGNHQVMHEGHHIPAKPCALSLAHFPIRSAAQLKRKVSAGWLSLWPHVPGACFQWKAIIEELRAGRELTPKTLERMAVEYASHAQWGSLPGSERERMHDFLPPVPDGGGEEAHRNLIHDPVPCSFDVRYPQKEADPFTVLLDTVESSVDQHLRERSIKDAVNGAPEKSGHDRQRNPLVARLRSLLRRLRGSR